MIQLKKKMKFAPHSLKFLFLNIYFGDFVHEMAGRGGETKHFEIIEDNKKNKFFQGFPRVCNVLQHLEAVRKTLPKLIVALL